MKFSRIEVFMGGLSLLMILVTLVLTVLQPVFESRTYNKLTGAHTTWWDAMWVELRVQDTPTKP